MKRHILLVAVLVTALSGCSTVGGWFGMSGSTQAKIKPAELAEIKATASLTKVWENSVGGGAPYIFSPATDGKAVYAAGKDGRVAKMELATGKELWRIEAGQTLSAGVGVGDGLVLVGTPKGELLAFNSDTGRPAWTARLSGEILVTPVVGNGMVAARSNDGNVWLLDAKDGKQRWVYNRLLPALILRVPSDMLLTSQALYVGYPGGVLVALALNNGAPLWETGVALPKGATELERIADVTGPIEADDNLVCAVAYQGRIGCFDRSNGNPVWVRDFSGLTGVGMGQRYIFAADEHGTVQSFDRNSGASPWKQGVLRDRQLATPAEVSNYVAVADYQGYVHLMSLESGAIVGRTASDGSPVVGSMLSLRSGLVVQTAKGGIYAFRIE